MARPWVAIQPAKRLSLFIEPPLGDLHERFCHQAGLQLPAHDGDADWCDAPLLRMAESRCVPLVMNMPCGPDGIVRPQTIPFFAKKNGKPPLGSGERWGLRARALEALEQIYEFQFKRQ